MELAELFQTSVPNINIHIRNLLAEGELSGSATIKEDLIVRAEGSRNVRRNVKLYNLDLILAVGYRVRSPRGTQFRQWALADWRQYAANFLAFNERPLLQGNGGISREAMIDIAHERYEVFDARRRADEARLADAEDIRELERISKEAGKA